jgi:hypothetical protein
VMLTAISLHLFLASYSIIIVSASAGHAKYVSSSSPPSIPGRWYCWPGLCCQAV